MPSPLSRWFGRLGRSEEQLTWSDARREAERTVAIPIGQAVDRQRVAVKGRIESMVRQRRQRGSWLEARLADESGAVTLVWMGRNEIPGVEVGRVMRVEGRIGVIDGVPHIFNPSYTLL